MGFDKKKEKVDVEKKENKIENYSKFITEKRKDIIKFLIFFILLKRICTFLPLLLYYQCVIK